MMRMRGRSSLSPCIPSPPRGIQTQSPCSCWWINHHRYLSLILSLWAECGRLGLGQMEDGIGIANADEGSWGGGALTLALGHRYHLQPRSTGTGDANSSRLTYTNFPSWTLSLYIKSRSSSSATDTYAKCTESDSFNKNPLGLLFQFRGSFSSSSPPPGHGTISITYNAADLCSPVTFTF